MNTNKEIPVNFGTRKLLTKADTSFHYFSKGAILALLLLSLISPAFAQNAQEAVRAHSTVAAFGQAGNVSYSLGQTFFSQTMSSCGYETAAGVQQAQLLHEIIDTAFCQNDVQPVAGFDFHSLDADGNLIPAGRYDSSHYTPSYLNYDSLTEITLTVWPVYEVWDTLRVQYADLESLGFHEGRNDKLLESENDCDSLLHYMVYVCGYPNVADGDNNIYGNTWVGNECWFGRNMRTTHDMDGNEVPSMIYSAPGLPNAEQMVNTYGRLYTWYATVNLPENSTDTPNPNGEGFVQGICPTGWHVPTDTNIMGLNAYPSEWLKSDNLWLHPGNNRIGMDIRPAGWYNPEKRRFENLLGYTYFWMDESVNLQVAHECTIMDGCDDTIIEDRIMNYGLSVRCVKDNIYSDTHWTEELRTEPVNN